MTYLAPHFDYDVFMSYAHGQVPGFADAPLRTWSQRFIDQLRTDIGALRSDFDTLLFCDDRDVDPTAELTREIKMKVERSGVRLIIMSEKYLDSDWCHRELDWFKAQFQGRRKPPGRVFVVRAVSTSTNRWPGFLRDESGHPDIGFQFHAETIDVGIEPYGWPDLKERTREFNQPFAKLRTTLIRRLQEIKMGLPPAATTNPIPVPVAITRPRRLYLHTAPGPDNIRVQVESELRQDGYSIVTAVPRATTDKLSDWHAEVNARIQAAQRCDALTLLRATDDDAFNDEFLEVGADELSRINMGRENGPLRCAILDKSSSPFLLADYAKQRGVELFNLNDAGWRPAFRAWLA